jgi:integrase
LATGMLQVRRTLVEQDGVFTTDEPKTDAGRRSIDLPQIAIDALHEHKTLLMAEGLDSFPWVFMATGGTHLRRTNVTRRSFHPILKAAGLKRIRFHDLRHSSATLLLSIGTHPKVVQERMGHREIAMTMDIYSHAIPTMQKDAAGKLNGLLKPKPKSPSN